MKDVWTEHLTENLLDLIRPTKSKRTSTRVHQKLYITLLHAAIPFQEVQNVRLRQPGLHHLLGHHCLHRQPQCLFPNRIFL